MLLTSLKHVTERQGDGLSPAVSSVCFLLSCYLWPLSFALVTYPLAHVKSLVKADRQWFTCQKNNLLTTAIKRGQGAP